MSVEDGSRIHVHEFRDGSMVVHRDRIDPSRGPAHAVAHVVCETRIGRFGVLVTFAVVAGLAVSRLVPGYRPTLFSAMVPG
jgi:hypothetical protein